LIELIKGIHNSIIGGWKTPLSIIDRARQGAIKEIDISNNTITLKK
jgi:hypothetical protein